MGEDGQAAHADDGAFRSPADRPLSAFPDEAECSGDAALAPPTLRRLSHVEYENTLRDLLGEQRLESLPLAPDAAVGGFENNARALGASSVLVEQYSEHARLVAAALAARELAACDEPSRCGDDFVARLGCRAFRRPLSEDELQRYGDFFRGQRDEQGVEGALRLTAEALLQAPSFLYHVELPAEANASSVAGPYAMASRLSYLLWQSMPDEELMLLAERGALSTPEQLAAQARRMLEDPKATSALVDFHRQWLGVGRVLGETKDPERFPEWQPQTSAEALEESLRFVEHVFREGRGTLEELLTDRTAFVTETLAELYGVPFDPGGERWQKVELPEERAGILTRAAFLAGYSHPATTSPPLRGVAVLDALLCSRPPPAPANADTSTPQAEEGSVATTRELFAQRTAPDQCQGCHRSINGLGFAFEQFDTVGRLRTQEYGLPVDASGTLFTSDGAIEFDGIVELSEELAASEQVQVCAVRALYRSAFGQLEGAADRCRVERLQGISSEHGGDLREALVALASSAQFAQAIPGGALSAEDDQ